MTELDISTEQLKRRHSAEAAMALHQWSVLDTPGGWKVKTHMDTYTILALPDGKLACSCLDYERYGPLGLKCKHVCGLLIFLEEGGKPHQKKLQKKETHV